MASLWPLALAAVAVAGCASNASNGEAARPPARILADLEAAAATARSVHVVGSERRGAMPVTVDLRLGRGGVAAGTLELDGARVRLVALAGRAYLDAPAAFWRRVGSAPAVRRLAGRWVEVGAGSRPFAAIAPFTSLSRLLAETLGLRPRLVKGKFTTVRGERAFTLLEREGGASVAVAAAGAVYPLELGGGPDRAALALEAWDAPLSVTAPSGAVALTG